MCSCRIELAAPASQVVDRFCCQLGLELGALNRIKLRRLKQRIDECPYVKARSPDDYRLFVDLARALHPLGRLGRPASRRVTLFRLGDIDPVVSNTLTLVATWLGRTNIEIT